MPAAWRAAESRGPCHHPARQVTGRSAHLQVLEGSPPAEAACVMRVGQSSWPPGEHAPWVCLEPHAPGALDPTGLQWPFVDDANSALAAANQVAPYALAQPQADAVVAAHQMKGGSSQNGHPAAGDSWMESAARVQKAPGLLAEQRAGKCRHGLIAAAEWCDLDVRALV